MTSPGSHTSADDGRRRTRTQTTPRTICMPVPQMQRHESDSRGHSHEVLSQRVQVIVLV